MAEIAIIGAGVSGLACARTLADSGHSVRIFEKSRGLGGRLATRRMGDVAIDHGAQYVTARGEDFRAFLAEQRARGFAASWEPRVEPPRSPETWTVGLPGMSGLAKPLAAGLAVAFQSRVLELRRTDAAWMLVVEGKAHQGPFDAVIVAIPAPQAIELLQDSPATPHFPDLDRVSIAPCLAGLFVFDRPLETEADVYRGHNGIGWAARNASKPGRNPDQETWLVHAGAAWTRTHLEKDPSAMAGPLLTLFFDQFGIHPVNPESATAHRWRYALVERALGEPCRFVPDLGIGVCGDWCIGPRVEAAYESGRAMAAQVLTTHPGPGALSSDSETG